jgi:hypothetical protein
MGIKIQDITSKSAKIVSTDLFEIAQVSGATYVSRKVTGSEINELSLDTSPQLGGNLDVNSNKITSASNGNVVIEPNGSGAILIGGNSTQPAEMRFMEDSDNGTNYVALKASTTLAASTTYTLPTADGTSGQVLSTNGSGLMSWSTDASGVPTARTISTNSPLSGGGDLSANRTLSIADAAADGTTKGAASFTAADFNATAGNISIDYTNGQAASGSDKGFLTSADWTTFNNKASYTPRVQTTASAATVTPVNTNDLVTITAQAAALALANPTGTWVEGQPLMIRIKDDGTARAITYGTNYRAIGVTLPTITVLSKTTYLGLIYNSTDTKWDVIGVTTQA